VARFTPKGAAAPFGSATTPPASPNVAAMCLHSFSSRTRRSVCRSSSVSWGCDPKGLPCNADVKNVETVNVDSRRFNSQIVLSPFIHAQANGGSIRAADAPLRFGESAHDPSALLSRIFVSNPVFIVPRSCSFSSHVFGFMQVRRRRLFCFRFLEFCDWSTSGQARYYGNRICSLRCR
jgi:hypothetical protein